MRPTKKMLGEDFLREHRVLDVRVLVAVSGGADSLALLKVLRDENFDVHVAHINHGLRGRESDDDADFVRELCETENIEYSMRRVHVENRDGHFSEDNARRARYQALIEIAREQHCSLVATGHTADDNLETILLHMARGATINGWGGIPSQRVLEESLRVVRPILHLSRAQTEAICRDANWIWRDDISNSSTRMARNRVRHEVIPLLADIGRKSRATLALQTSRAAQIRRDENEFLDCLAHDHLQQLQLVGKENALTLDGARFADLPLAMQRRVLRLALQQFEANDVGAEQVEAIRRHVAARAVRCVWSLPRSLKVEWTSAMCGNRLRLWRVQ